MSLVSDLKGAILNQAISGKLSSHQLGDSDVRNLLETARKAATTETRNQRIKTKVISSIDDSDIPFDIPEGWTWVRLGEVTIIARGGSPRPIKSYITDSSDGINWIKIGDSDKSGKYIFSTKEKIIPEGISKSRMVHSGDFLLTNSMSFGRPYILKTDGCIHDGWLVISQPIEIYNQNFLYLLLSSPFAYHQFCSEVDGAVVKNLNSDKVANCLFPLPPIEEQQRIVNRVDELMAKVDELEKIEKELDELEKGFADNLKESVLQSALQGRMTDQRETFSVVENQIDRLTKGKKSEIAANEIPYEIPKEWIWVRANEVGDIIGGGTPKTTHSEYWSSAEIPWVRPADMSHTERYISSGEKWITNLGLEKSSAKLFKAGSVVISTRAPIGYVQIAKNDLCTSQGCKTFSPKDNSIVDSIYIYWVFKNRIPDLQKRASGTTFKEISGKGVGETLIPLPPLEEQQRIVEKIDAIMPKIEELKSLCI